LKSVKPRPKYGIFSIFQDGGRPPSWICSVCDWTTRKVSFGCLYHFARFGWNRCSSFGNMQVLVFCDFGWKMPIHTRFWGFWGTFLPKNVTHRLNLKKDRPWAEPRQP